MIPEKLSERLGEIYSDKIYDSIAAIRNSNQVIFRINHLKASSDCLLDLEIPFQKLDDNIYHCHVDDKKSLTSHSLYQEGALFIQNPSSLLPVDALEPQKNEYILDMCAAPGGKTSLVAESINNVGRIDALEKSRTRYYRMQALFKQLGVHSANSFCVDATHWWKKNEEKYDRLLLDAPCSGEGAILRGEKSNWNLKKIKQLARIQSRLLFSGFKCLKVGGTLVYSTCTTAPEENESVISRFLGKYEGVAEVTPLKFSKKVAFIDGLESFGKKRFHESCQLTKRVVPTESHEAFFVCKMKKTDSF